VTSSIRSCRGPDRDDGVGVAPCTGGAMASSATRAMNVLRPIIARQRGGDGDARGTRGVGCVSQAPQGIVVPLPGHSGRRTTKAVVHPAVIPDGA